MTNKPTWENGGAKILAYLSRALFLAGLLDRYHPERHYNLAPSGLRNTRDITNVE